MVMGSKGNKFIAPGDASFEVANTLVPPPGSLAQTTFMPDNALYAIAPLLDRSTPLGLTKVTLSVLSISNKNV
jgi:hypothetical protein